MSKYVTQLTIDPENNLAPTTPLSFCQSRLSTMASPPTTTVHRLLDDAAAAVDDSVAAVIGLNSWIDAALHSLKKTADSDSNSNCSHQHHLKIAHCLAEQLCVVDVEGDEFTAGGGERQHEAASSWTQFISVRCGRARLSSEEKKIESEEKSITSITELHHDDLEPVPLNHYYDQSEPEGLLGSTTFFV